jgi:hypothetical protein
MNRLRSSLAPHIASGEEGDAERARRAAKAAYHEHGIVLINPDWLAGWADRQQLILLADQVHGRRAG